MAYQFATYEKKDRVGIVTVNRPERMNALHPPANFELHEIWNEFERDPDVWVGILTGRHMTAQEAHRLGVVNEVVPLADLMPTAMKWANEILDCAPLSIRASKQAVLMGLGHPLDVALRMNYSEAERLRRSEDTVEGPRAFAEKRKPNWKAR